MATNHLIKQAFGNHDMMRLYLEHLINPETLPPFPPVLYRFVAYGSNDDEAIMDNERRKHKAINRKIKHELIVQFAVYQRLQNDGLQNGGLQN